MVLNKSIFFSICLWARVLQNREERWIPIVWDTGKKEESSGRWLSSLPELSAAIRAASRPADSAACPPTVEHSAAGEWCRGRSTKTPTSWLRWGSRLADSTLDLLWRPYMSSIGPSEMTPYDFVALLEMLPNLISDKDIKLGKFWGAAQDCPV